MMYRDVDTEVEGVGVMKDEELNLEEIEDFLTLGYVSWSTIVHYEEIKRECQRVTGILMYVGVK